MDTHDISAPPRAQSRHTADKHPNQRHRAGVGLTHDNARHTTRFTVIGNHLAQHPELSALAIGLGVHIQSLPAGARVDIKTLAARFPEGTTRIAAALRELETHGYLRRERHRIPDGRIVTRTISCNQPGSRRRDPRTPPRSRSRRSRSRTVAPQAPPRRTAPRVPGPRPPPDGHRPPRGPPPPRPPPAPVGLRHGPPRPRRRRLAGARRQPHSRTPRTDHDLPPEGLRRPAALLAHRLTPNCRPRHRSAPRPPPPTVRHPLQNCDGCDRAFRSPTPGRCHDCRTDLPEAA
jgi:hypothetical protein